MVQRRHAGRQKGLAETAGATGQHRQLTRDAAQQLQPVQGAALGEHQLGVRKVGGQLLGQRMLLGPVDACTQGGEEVLQRGLADQALTHPGPADEEHLTGRHGRQRRLTFGQSRQVVGRGRRAAQAFGLRRHPQRGHAGRAVQHPHAAGHTQVFEGGLDEAGQRLAALPRPRDVEDGQIGPGLGGRQQAVDELGQKMAEVVHQAAAPQGFTVQAIDGLAFARGLRADVHRRGAAPMAGPALPVEVRIDRPGLVHRPAMEAREQGLHRRHEDVGVGLHHARLRRRGTRSACARPRSARAAGAGRRPRAGGWCPAAN